MAVCDIERDRIQRKGGIHSECIWQTLIFNLSIMLSSTSIIFKKNKKELTHKKRRAPEGKTNKRKKWQLQTNSEDSYRYIFLEYGINNALCGESDTQYDSNLFLVAYGKVTNPAHSNGEKTLKGTVLSSAAWSSDTCPRFLVPRHFLSIFKDFKWLPLISKQELGISFLIINNVSDLHKAKTQKRVSSLLLLPWLVSGAAITKYHKAGKSNNRNFLSHSSEGQNSESKVSTRVGLSQGVSVPELCPCLQQPQVSLSLEMALFPLHIIFPLCTSILCLNFLFM